MISLPDGQRIGAGAPCFVIAEAGVNHNGEIEMARQLIDAAVAARANAVKFQTYAADRIATSDAPKAAYQKLTTNAAESQHEMLRRLELSADAHRELMSYCRKRGLLFMSTPFDEESADFLDELGVPLFKVSSGDVTNLPFLAHVARKSKPMIVSTGMADLNEVAAAVRTIEGEGLRELVLLHCVSNYPAAAGEINLRAMLAMNVAFGVPVGYSDHASGAEVALAAVALGACVIEKHFTLDRNLPGPDHQASLEPAELTALVTGIRTVEAALGDGVKRPAASERDTAQVARKSLVAARDIPAGTILTGELIAIMRPGTGLAPSMRAQLIGRTVRVAMSKGTMFSLEKLA